MTIATKTLKIVPALAIAGMVFATPHAYAAGESTTTSTPSCKKGKMWDKKKDIRWERYWAKKRVPNSVKSMG